MKKQLGDIQRSNYSSNAPAGSVTIRVFLVVLGIFSVQTGFSSETFDVELSDAVDVKSGYIKFQTSKELEPELTDNTFGSYSIDISRFHKKIFASYIGYRAVQDIDLGRVVYNSGYMGIKYYFMGLGVPIRARRNNSLISWDLPFKPYINVGGSIGKMLIQSLGDGNILELSGEFIGVQLGVGFSQTILENIAFDFVAQIEQVVGYGPIEFESTNLMGLLGIKYYY